MPANLDITGSSPGAGIKTPARPDSSGRWAAALLLFALIACGCAQAPTGPPFTPPEPAPDHRARLVLYRTDQPGSLASVKITIDGLDFGRFRNHEYETTLMTPGTHMLRAGLRGFGLLAWGWNAHRFRLDPGETTYLQISVRLAARDAPDTRDLDIAGRPSGAVSENVFIVPKSAQAALDDLGSTTRLAPGGSNTN
jgi:hypothetical protein